MAAVRNDGPAVRRLGGRGGTIIGALGGDLLGETDRFGLDTVYPTFLLALLVAELRERRTRTVADIGALITPSLVPITPPGAPILAASAATLIGLRRSRYGYSSQVAW